MSSFFDGETAEEAQFNNLALAWIGFGKSLQRFIELEQFIRAFFRSRQDLFERDQFLTAASFLTTPCASMVHQYAADHARGKTKELGSALPFDVFPPHHPKVSLMYQRGGLKRVAGPFQRKSRAGDGSQLAVDQGKQLARGLRISPAPFE